MKNKLCHTCHKSEDCETPCAAIEVLFQIYDKQDEKDKVARIRNLKKQLGIQDAEPSKSLKRLADKIIKRFPEFSIIREFNIKIGYVVSQEAREAKRSYMPIVGRCRKSLRLTCLLILLSHFMSGTPDYSTKISRRFSCCMSFGTS